MRNITLKLDDEVLNRVRHAAVDDHQSVSAWVQGIISQELKARDLYEQNRNGARMVLREGLSLGGTPLTRDEAHAR